MQPLHPPFEGSFAPPMEADGTIIPDDEGILAAHHDGGGVPVTAAAP